MLEVAPDQMTGSEGGHEAQLTGQHGGADHSGQLGGVLARVSRMRPLDPKHLQARGLGRKDSSTANGADLDAGHGAGDVEVLPPLPPGLHQRDAVGAANCLGRVLARGYVDRCYNVRGMSVET